MRQSTKLILNTGATYVRMGITVGIGLLVTRYTLRELGESDFGLWGLIVSTVAWLTILSDSLIHAADRFLAFEIGRAEGDRLRRTFASATVLFSGVAGLFVLVSVPMAYLAVPALNVQPARVQAAHWALIMTAVSTALTVAGTPYRSMFIAHQEMVRLSLIEIGDALLRFLVVIAIMYVPGDRLLMFTGLIAGSQALLLVFVIAMCARRYPEARVLPTHASRAVLKEMMNFGGWSVLGNLAYRMRLSGPPTILAASYGTGLNAAYAIANQVAGYQMQLAAALSRASRPAIVNAKGADNQHLAERLTLLTSKYSSWMVGGPLVVLMLETEQLLRLWLGEYPESAPAFVRVVCVIFALPWLIIGHHHAIHGTGRIRRFVVWSLACDGSAFAGAWLWGIRHGAPTGVLWIVAGGVAIFTFGTPLLFAGQTRVPVSHWVRSVLWPTVLVCGVCGSVGLGVQAVAEQGWLRLVALGLCCGLAFVLACWGLGMSPDERGHLRRIFHAVIVRIPVISRVSGLGRSEFGTSGGAPSAQGPAHHG